MGTNYYAKINEEVTCKECGHVTGGDLVHIGKSSAGWVFALNVLSSECFDDWEDWRRFIKYSSIGIVDEYGKEISLGEMDNIVTKRSHPSGRLKRLFQEEPTRWERGDGTWDIAKYQMDFS